MQFAFVFNIYLCIYLFILNERRIFSSPYEPYLSKFDEKIYIDGLLTFENIKENGIQAK